MLVMAIVLLFVSIFGALEALQKPTVQQETGRTTEFLPGATVKLTCSTNDTGSLTYQWKKDGTSISITNKTSPVYEISGADAGKTGKFSCLVRDESVNLESTESVQLEIKPLSATSNSVTPQLSDLPPAAAPGADLDLKCIDIPFGATYKFRIDSAATTTTTVKQNSNNRNISCVLDDVQGVTFKNKESTAVPWKTQDASKITSVFISSSPSVVYEVPASVRFSCFTTPDAKYMTVGNTTVEYSFPMSFSGSICTNFQSRRDGNQYVIESRAACTFSLTCTATYGGQSQASSPVTVQFRTSSAQDGISTPVLYASGYVISVGGRLVLTCGDPQEQVTYTWTKNGTAIPGQPNRIIQINNFQKSDEGTYTCTAKKEPYQKTSNEVYVKSSAPTLALMWTLIFVLVAATAWQIF